MRQPEMHPGKKPAEPSGIAEGLPASAPPASEDHAAVEALDIRSTEPTAMQVFFAWEKLRLLYNAALVLAVMFRLRFMDEMWPESLMVGALFANLCFCLGPVLEGYLCWMGLHRRLTRMVIFGIGMFLAMALAMNTRPQDLAMPLH